MNIQKVTYENIHYLAFIDKIGRESLPIFYTIEDLICSEDEIYVYINNNNVVGYIIYDSKSTNHAHIKSIAVSRQSRLSGVGTSLLQFVKKRFSKISLYVQKGNDAKDFYKKNQFIEKYKDENYYTTLQESCAYYMEWDASLLK